MSFCWFTSFIGYPNFYTTAGRQRELADAFLTLAEAASKGISYSEAKLLFPGLDHAQVETKKAAFQEYGLLYVVPNSNLLSLTPLGRQVLETLRESKDDPTSRRKIYFGLCRALSRYQFNNPLPVGGNRYRSRAQSTDVRPYLACFYALMRLDGVLASSELMGAFFGLQHMAQLLALVPQVAQRRNAGTQFMPLSVLPSNRKTADNLRIYFMSHLSLDWQILSQTEVAFYGLPEQGYELTQLGYDLVEVTLDEEWPGWRTLSDPPSSASYTTIDSYFQLGAGALVSETQLAEVEDLVERQSAEATGGVLDPADVEELRNLPRRSYQEGRERLLQHVKVERVRNKQLVNSAKRHFKEQAGRLFCEVCSFDFEQTYGSRGANFIEAHHRTPLSELVGEVSVTEDDLAMVCPNCHRMLHRPPWITVEELRTLVAERLAARTENIP